MTPCRLGQAHPLLGRPALRLWRRRRGEGGRPLSRHQRCARDRHRRARAARGEDRGVVTPGNTHLKERTVYAQSITVLSEDAPSLESTPTLNRFGTSRVDRAANGPCRSYSAGFGTEVRLFLENRTTAAANVRTGVDCLVRPGGSSRFVTRPFCQLGPASTDQVLGVIGRHFDGAVRAHVDVPAREGLHGPDAGWGKQANPCSNAMASGVPSAMLQTMRSRPGWRFSTTLMFSQP